MVNATHKSLINILMVMGTILMYQWQGTPLGLSLPWLVAFVVLFIGVVATKAYRLLYKLRRLCQFMLWLGTLELVAQFDPQHRSGIIAFSGAQPLVPLIMVWCLVLIVLLSETRTIHKYPVIFVAGLFALVMRYMDVMEIRWNPSQGMDIPFWMCMRGVPLVLIFLTLWWSYIRPRNMAKFKCQAFSLWIEKDCLAVLTKGDKSPQLIPSGEALVTMEDVIEYREKWFHVPSGGNMINGVITIWKGGSYKKDIYAYEGKSDVSIQRVSLKELRKFFTSSVHSLVQAKNFTCPTCATTGVVKVELRSWSARTLSVWLAAHVRGVFTDMQSPVQPIRDEFRDLISSLRKTSGFGAKSNFVDSIVVKERNRGLGVACYVAIDGKGEAFIDEGLPQGGWKGSLWECTWGTQNGMFTISGPVASDVVRRTFSVEVSKLSDLQQRITYLQKLRSLKN